MDKPMRNRKKLYPHDNVLIHEYNRTKNPELLVMAYKLHNGKPPRQFRLAWESLAREMAEGKQPLKYNRKKGERALQFMSDEEVKELDDAYKEQKDKGATKYQSIAYTENNAAMARIYRDLDDHAPLLDEALEQQKKLKEQQKKSNFKPENLKCLGEMKQDAEQQYAHALLCDLIQLFEEFFKIMKIPKLGTFEKYPPVALIIQLLYLKSWAFEPNIHHDEEVKELYKQNNKRLLQKLEALQKGDNTS